MPGSYRAPGVYVEELPSSAHPVVGVSTSTAAFVDVFAQGPVDVATKVSGPGDFERAFGGVWSGSEASVGISQFFLNGGSQAWVVRVADGTAAAASYPTDTKAEFRVVAQSAGAWGNSICYGIQPSTAPGADTATNFDLVIGRLVTGPGGKSKVVAQEVYRKLSITATDARYCVTIVSAASQFAKLQLAAGAKLPEPTYPTPAAGAPAPDVTTSTDPAHFHALGSGTDVTLPPAAKSTALKKMLVGSPNTPSGIWALDAIAPDIFNILCIPAMANLSPSDATDLIANAETFCEGRRAMLLVDPPASQDDNTAPSALVTAMQGLGLDPNPNAAVYFPRLVISDPAGGTRKVGPSGTVAGVWARMDTERGVWKAPAGTEATLRGARPVAVLPDSASGTLNPLGVNVLRTFPVYNNVVWGSRTLEGADLAASQWKYVPVRRTALFIEESLRQGLQWVVFEPNDEPLWAQIRLNVTAFMQNLFRLGAFAGTTPNEAFLVKCDSDTTTPYDVSTGVVNIRVGFQPLQPCEFVVIQIQQLTQPAEA